MAITVPQYQTSQPVAVSAGSIITVTPSAGATAIVEYTRGSATDIANAIAVWSAWPKGTLTAAAADLVDKRAFVRVTAQAGAVTLDINAAPTATDLGVFVSDWGAPSNSVVDASGNITSLKGPSGATIKIAPYTFNTNVVLHGDSTSSLCTDAGLATPSAIQNLLTSGYFAWANAAMGGQLNLVANCGISGQTTAQMLARIGSGSTVMANADPTIYNAGVYIVWGGTNDVGAAVSAATIIATLKANVQKLQSTNTLVVLVTLPPRGPATQNTAGGALQLQTIRVVNAWIRAYCASPGGPVLADFYRALYDPATELFAAGLTQDGVHPNNAGASYCGQVLATALLPYFPIVDTPNLDALKGYTVNPNAIGSNASAANGVILGAGITGTAPNFWSSVIVRAGTGVGSSIAPAASVVYREVFGRMACSATTNYDGAQFLIGGMNIGATHRGGWAVDNPFPGGRWPSTTAVQIGDRCIPSGAAANVANAGLWAVCTTGGTTTTGTEPIWPTQASQTITDNGVVWEMTPTPFALRKSQHYAASFYVAIGTIFRPGTPTGFYYQCTTAGQALAADPTWSTVLGGTTTDGTAVWTTINYPTYAYYMEAEVAVSGLTAGKGCNPIATLNISDDANVATSTAAFYSDTNPANYGVNASGLLLPATMRLKSPVLKLGNDKGMRFMYVSIGASLDAAASVNIDVRRVSIKAVVTP